MSRAAKAGGPRATVDDLFAIPASERHHELIDGELVEKASPSAEHGRTQRKLSVFVDPFDRRAGGPMPGGWWLMTEVEVELAADEVYRPDLVGWRRERVPDCPTGTPVRVRPDWIAEILSETNSSSDRVRKLNRYHAHGVPHYWLVDPLEETLSVFRWSDAGYLLVLAATAEQRVHAEPFDALELAVGELFGHEPV
jgi:Uma2 family endonuclease